MPDENKVTPDTWKEITLNYLGTLVRGSYKVVDRLVIVVSGSDSKTANLGILPAERLAHMLLREIAFEKRNKSPLVRIAKILNDQ
jgi:hypothetical protein